MSSAVRVARLAVARHGRRAHIAYNLSSDHRSRPGARREALDGAARIDFLAEVLLDWHLLATDADWPDDFALSLWNQELPRQPLEFALERHAAVAQVSNTTPAERRKPDDALLKRIRALAVHLAGKSPLRNRLHDAWNDRWQADDRQWRARLRWLARWLMPRGRASDDAARRNVGGLSIKRIATLTEFRRKVQVGFHLRMKPDESPAEIGFAFGKGTLDVIEQLKENRIKQLASRIVEAALGIGIEKHGGRDCHGRESKSPASVSAVPCGCD